MSVVLSLARRLNWYIWVQDLNKEERRKRLLYRRGSIYPRTDERRWEARWEAVVPGGHFHLGFQTDQEDGYGLTLGLVAFTLYLHFCPRGWDCRTPERNWDLRAFSGGLWWTWGQTRHEWRSSDPWWREGHWNVVNTLLGKEVYTNVDGPEQQIAIPLPEYAYAGTAHTMHSTWKRPRWPRTKTVYRVQIDIPDGIPEPGKGENSYDCGDDATFGMTCPADSIEDAIGKVVASVLRTRRQRGGVDWVPDGGWKVQA